MSCEIQPARHNHQPIGHQMSWQGHHKPKRAYFGARRAVFGAKSQFFFGERAKVLVLTYQKTNSASRSHCFWSGTVSKWTKNVNIWPKMTENANFWPILVVLLVAHSHRELNRRCPGTAQNIQERRAFHLVYNFRVFSDWRTLCILFSVQVLSMVCVVGW